MKKTRLTSFPHSHCGWEVLSYSHTLTKPSGRKEAIYIAECPQCKKDTPINRDKMKQNKSCGCATKKLQTQAKITHGQTDTALFRVWKELKQRCFNPKSSKYSRYGGRGISVCDEWLEFEPFMEWSLANGYVAPAKGKRNPISIDRRENDGNYEPSNCRWTNSSIQNQNKGVTKANTTGYTGITKRGSRFESRVTHRGIRTNIGTFATIADAVMARNKWILDNNTNHPFQTI